VAAFSRALSRQAWRSSLFVKPATVLRWHRELVARPWGAEIRWSCCGEFVFMDEAPEQVATAHLKPLAR
jgi:hypothetical protein